MNWRMHEQLAARVAVSALHRTTLSSFSETIALLSGYVHRETATACGKVHKDLADLVAANAQVIYMNIYVRVCVLMFGVQHTATQPPTCNLSSCSLQYQGLFSHVGGLF